MAVDKRHLRHIATNYYGTTPVAVGGRAAIGAAVPVGKRRYFFYAKIWHDTLAVPGAPAVVELYRDGAVGAAFLDYMSLSGSGAAPVIDSGEPFLELCIDIETPMYILEGGEILGIGNPVAAADTYYFLGTAYDEP